jgi:hypothetical protein
MALFWKDRLKGILLRQSNTAFFRLGRGVLGHYGKRNVAFYELTYETISKHLLDVNSGTNTPKPFDEFACSPYVICLMLSFTPQATLQSLTG